jgi:hypothetical protein
MVTKNGKDHPLDEGAESVKRLTKDLKLAAKKLTDTEARFLVDGYYIMQENRKRSDNQVRALGENAEPNSVLAWMAEQADVMESQLKRALDAYTDAHPMGNWMRQVVGIGPVISAGLLAHISMEPWKCMRQNLKNKACKPGEPCTPQCGRVPTTTTGKIWRFAGLDPTSVWEKGQKRPWNATLKTLCWKAGQSFMKFSNREDCFYGQKYKERKIYEWERNLKGGQAVRATSLLEKIGKTTEAYPWLVGCYHPDAVRALRTVADGSLTPPMLAAIKLKPGEGVPMLPPGHIDAMARRWAVKLFLAHLHDAWFEGHFGKKPPLPYPIAFLGHADVIKSPIAAPKSWAEERPAAE